MAVCKYCQLEMNEADGCVKMPVPTQEGPYDPVPYGSERRDEPPAPGQYHHRILIGDPPRCHDCAALPRQLPSPWLRLGRMPPLS